MTDTRAMRALLLASVLFSTPAAAVDKLLWGSSALLVADWLQTRDLLATPELIETNPIIAAHPEYVDAYFSAALLAHVALYTRLPPPWRERYGWLVVGIQGGFVWQNWRIGLSFRF